MQPGRRCGRPTAISKGAGGVPEAWDDPLLRRGDHRVQARGGRCAGAVRGDAGHFDFRQAIANGFPVAAVVGRADLIDQFATGGVLHGGTFNAQPVALAAMLATAGGLTAEHFADDRSAEHGGCRTGVRAALAEAGITAQVMGFPLMFHVAGAEAAAAQLPGDRAGRQARLSPRWRWRC